MTVAIIDYGSGNLRSAEKAFERAARETGAQIAIRVTRDPAVVAAADRIVLPGVGAFADCRRGLGAIDGMIEALTTAVIDKGRPFLGICVGMQLMARRGYEHGSHDGLGWIDGEVAEIAPLDPALKIPHMGWNDLELTAEAHPLFAGFQPGDHAYFVHSYAMRDVAPAQVLARVDYGGPVVAAVGRDNIVGTQFHPEKSQAVGLRLIGNFLQWRP
ncbi:imidazole glycerol phosphate synthase subunit HisH [Govanella unica]|uniref:Imidazole glycerol phosphate synthase subunit HisH n=1 Tax=Govanella unica TaxID=2975056 RepID=A0A9X3Z829_9PROT|nr:imidazole glycerol phosphate synthase subunit HisH [Govania unica]MDA5194599.1 imidazole glycerol phosphate synthase subunit HisH [Govania unica]